MMKAFNYAGLLPKKGTIAVLGDEIEEILLKAVAYVNSEEDRNLKVFPLTPSQTAFLEEYDIEQDYDYPDVFYLEADRLTGDYIVTGNSYSPSLASFMLFVSHENVVLLDEKYHMLSVEVLSHAYSYVEPLVSMYGEIVDTKETHLSSSVVRIVPYRWDVEHLKIQIESMPFVVGVGIFEDRGYRKITIKR